MIKRNQKCLIRKAKAIELATGDGSIKIFDAIGDFVDFKDAEKLSQVFCDLLKVPNFSLSAVRGVSSTIAYLLCHSSFFRSFIPANEVGLTLIHAFAWSAILTQRCDNGKRLGDVIAANTAYLDKDGKTQMVNPIDVFENSADDKGASSLPKLLSLADAFNSTLKELQSRPVASFVADEGTNGSLKGANSHPTWKSASELVSEAQRVFGTFKPNSYIPPIACLFNLLVQVQVNESASLEKLGADPVLFNTVAKERIDLPEILTWSELTDLIKKVGKAAIQRDAYAKFSKENASVAALQGDVNNAAYMGASLFTIDPNRYAEKFLDVANAYESAVVEANYTFQRFESKVDKLADYLLKGATADELSYAGNEEIIFNDAAKTAFALYLADCQTQNKLPGAQTLTKSDYADEHWSMKPVMAALIRVLSLYNEVTYEDVRCGFKVVLDGSLSSRVALVIERSVLNNKSYVAAHPVFSREPKGDRDSTVAITRFGLESVDTNKFVPDSIGLRTNQKISSNDFRQQAQGGTYVKVTDITRGSAQYLAETLDADTLLMEAIVNDQASSVTFVTTRCGCWWIKPAWHTRSLGTGSNVEYLFSCAHNKNAGATLTTYERVNSTDLKDLTTGPGKTENLGKYLNLIIEGHVYCDHEVTGSEEVSPQLLNDMLAYVQRLATGKPCAIEQHVSGMESEYFDKFLVDADSSVSYGQTVLTSEVNRAYSMTGEDLVAKLSPLCGELELFSQEDRSLACKIYKILVTTYIPSAAASLLVGGPGRYKDCVPNGRYIAVKEETYTLSVPLIMLPQATRAAIEHLSGTNFYSVATHGRTVLKLRLKRDGQNKVVQDKRFGSVAEVVVVVNDHGNPDKSNLTFGGPGSFKALFRNSDDKYFYYPRDYGISAIDNVRNDGSLVATLHKIPLLGERASKLNRAPTLILSDDKTAVDINSLIVSPLAARCLSMKVEQSEKDLALDIVDEAWPRASLYCAALVAGLYAAVEGVVLDSYKEFFDFDAFNANIESFESHLVGRWSDSFTPYLIGVGNNVSTTVADLSVKLKAVCFADMAAAESGKSAIVDLLKILDVNAYTLIEKAELHSLDLAAFPLCTALEAFGTTPMVDKILSNDIVDWIPYKPVVTGLKNFGADVLGEGLANLVSAAVSRIVDANVNCLRRGESFSKLEHAQVASALDKGGVVKAVSLSPKGEVLINSARVPANFVLIAKGSDDKLSIVANSSIGDGTYGLFESDGASLVPRYAFTVGKDKEGKVEITTAEPLGVTPVVGFERPNYRSIAKFVKDGKLVNLDGYTYYTFNPLTGAVEKVDFAAGVESKTGFFVIDDAKNEKSFAVLVTAEKVFGRSVERAVFFKESK